MLPETATAACAACPGSDTPGGLSEPDPCMRGDDGSKIKYWIPDYSTRG